jgi:dUTP pyrophosphatase
MEEITVEITLLPHASGLPLPERATAGSSGVDLRAAIREIILVRPGGRVLVPTGLRVAIPEGYEWQVRPRSGLAIREGITVLNTPGTIDSDYRGEVCVILVNLGSKEITIKRGDRIAQAVLSPVVSPVIRLVGELSDTERGEGGFGHSG